MHPAWRRCQGAEISRYSSASAPCQAGVSTPKNGILFLREPLATDGKEEHLKMGNTIKTTKKTKEYRSVSARNNIENQNPRQCLVFSDNRALSESQDQIKQKLSGHVKHSNNTVFQRMAVMATDDMNQQKDALVWNNLQYAVTESGPPTGDLKTNKVWKDLTGKKEIRIVEHGDVGKVGGKSASEIANSMKPDLDRSTNRNAPEISQVIFQSCYSGIEGAKSSLASDMKDELKKMDQNQATVVGRKGIAFGFEGMGEETARTDAAPYRWKNRDALTLCRTLMRDKSPHWNEYGFKAYHDAMYSLRNAKTKSKRDVFKSPFIYDDPWALIGKSKMQWNQMSEKARREMISNEMAPYWAQLKRKMAGWGWLWKGFSGFSEDQYLKLK
jgi:hypothetical protein